MNRRVLFVYPEYPDTFWSFRHALAFVHKKASFPPLGLLTVASMLPPSWEVRLVDQNVEELTEEHLEWCDVVFVSAMIVQEAGARRAMKRAKQQNKIVVAGGPAFTAKPASFVDADHLVLGEAEPVMQQFLEDFENGAARRIYQSGARPDITKTPSPRWSLLKMKHYATMLVQYSRGCPFRCDFCDITVMNGREQRAKSPAQFIHELQTLFEAGWRGSVFIVDDNFIGNYRNAERMLPELIEWQKARGYPFRFLTEASVNLSKMSLLMTRMREANFFKVFLGIETPSAHALRECGKFQNIASDLLSSVQTIQKNGMQVMGGFIIGFDSDKPGIFRRQAAFIQRAGIPTAMVGLLTALPGTELFHRLTREGRIRDAATGNNTDGTLNYESKLPRQMLLGRYRQLFDHLYSPKIYYKRVAAFLKYYKPSVRGKSSLSDVLAFFRSAWHIGILSHARHHYWWLLARTMITNIRAFPIAVELAIYQIHFERVAAAMTRAAG